MADIEKVIRGLERCSKETCPSIFSKEYEECEYTDGLYCRRDRLIAETIELLKEQQETIKRLKDKLFAFPDAWIHCKDCKNGVKSSTFQYYPNLTWCNKHSKTHNDDWFCADGEQK